MALPTELNRRALGESYLNRSECTSGMPVYLAVESTSICNLKCVMCPYPGMDRVNQHMPMTVYEKLIAEAAGSVEFMWLHLFGEPLLNPRIYEMIELATNAGIATGISTNGTRLTERAAEALLASSLSVLVVSLDGATAETYERIRVGARFERVTANIRRFAEMKRASGSQVWAVLQMINLQPNELERATFSEEWSNAGMDAVFVKPFHSWANQNEQLSALRPSTQPPLPPGICHTPWSGLTVLSDGTVVPCANDYDGRNPLGDLKTQSLAEIWNGDKMRRLRRMLGDEGSDRSGTICERCPFPTATHEQAATATGPFDAIAHHAGPYGVVSPTMPRLRSKDPHMVDIALDEGDFSASRGEVFTRVVEVVNRTPFTLRTAGENAVHLSYHWFDAATDACELFEGRRTALNPPLGRGERRRYAMQVQAPPRPGRYRLQVSPVQEGVFWFEDVDQRNSASAAAAIT